MRKFRSESRYFHAAFSAPERHVRDAAYRRSPICTAITSALSAPGPPIWSPAGVGDFLHRPPAVANIPRTAGAGRGHSSRLSLSCRSPGRAVGTRTGPASESGLKAEGDHCRRGTEDRRDDAPTARSHRSHRLVAPGATGIRRGQTGTSVELAL